MRTVDDFQFSPDEKVIFGVTIFRDGTRFCNVTKNNLTKKIKTGNFDLGMIKNYFLLVLNKNAHIKVEGIFI